jgi:AcrR family transcriptional regulator
VPRETLAKCKIRRAALELFGAHGYENVSLREIAQRATVSVSLVVHHYRTKRGVVLAVDEGLVDDARASAHSVFATHARRPACDAAVLVGDALFQALAQPASTRAYLRRALLDDRQEIHEALKSRVLALAEELVCLVLPAAHHKARSEHAEHLLTVVLGHVALGGIVTGGPADVELARQSCRSGLRSVFHSVPAARAHDIAPGG